jgi:anti-sigma factor RsiW
MIRCCKLADFLFEFTSGRLPAVRRVRLERHLDVCSCCAAYVESYRLTVEMARKLPRPPLPSRLAQQVQALLDEGRTPIRREYSPQF